MLQFQINAVLLNFLMILCFARNASDFKSNDAEFSAFASQK